MAGRRQAGGFTLLELMAVVAVIIVLVVVFVYAITAAQERARIATCAANLRQMSMGLSAYAGTNRGWYPLAATDSRNGTSGSWYGREHPNDKTDYYTINLIRALWNTPGGKTPWPEQKPCQTSFPLYVSDWRIMYCPSTVNTKFYHVSVEDWAWNYTAASWRNCPPITYNYANGNSPGFGGSAPSNAPYYRGKPTLRGDGAGTVPLSGTDSFAAGFATDPPTWIVLADVTQINTSGQWDVDGLASDDSECPNVNHKTGFNTLYNDSHVAFTAFSQAPPKAGKYYNLESWYNGDPTYRWYVVYGPK